MRTSHSHIATPIIGRVKYLQSSGKQWIDTDYISNAGLASYVIRCGHYSRVASAYEIMCGAYSYSEPPKIAMRTTMTGLYVQQGAIIEELTNDQNTFNTFEYKENGGFYMNGTLICALQPSKWYSRHFYLFNGSQEPTRMIAGRIEYMKMFESGNPVRDFVPALRKSDSKPGMLDLVTNTLYVNQGTGEFGYEKMDGTIVAPI